MANTERLKALQLVREAKDAVSDALSTVNNATDAKPLESLENCLENLEGDLICSVLEDKIGELKGYQKQLQTINSEISQNIDKLKAVAEKVNTAAKAIGIVVDIIGKASELGAL